jgi:hypothetical protein
MYRGSRHLGKITGPYSPAHKFQLPPLECGTRRWARRHLVAKVGTSKAGGAISQQAAVQPWLAADAHGNKQTNSVKVGKIRYSSATFSLYSSAAHSVCLLCAAPEVQTTSMCSIVSDMFSLGLVVCAIFNQGRPLIQANHSGSTYMKQLEVVSKPDCTCP